MKKDIHPKYYEQARVYVGGEFVGTVGSTKPELHLEVWSGTHPFYTGEQRIIDTEGQVDRFQKRLERKVAERGGQSRESASPTQQARHRRDRGRRDDRDEQRTRCGTIATPGPFLITKTRRARPRRVCFAHPQK
jgi:large subunit ribosomal protein L31